MRSIEPEVDPGKNVRNAFKVVIQTYESIQKLLPELDIVAREEGFVSISPTPLGLRYRSDTDSTGWLISSFIKLYQNSTDQAHSSIEGLRIGPILGIELSFAWKDDDHPLIYLSRFDYDPEMIGWKGLPAVTDHWRFYWPLRRDDCEVVSESPFRVRVPPANLKCKYFGLEKVTYTTTDLMSIVSRDKIRGSLIQILRQLSELRP